MKTKTLMKTPLALAMIAASSTPGFGQFPVEHRRPRRSGDRHAVNVMTCWAGNPPGSTDPVLRANRRARRKRRMALRKLRGWR